MAASKNGGGVGVGEVVKTRAQCVQTLGSEVLLKSDHYLHNQIMRLKEPQHC